MKLNTNLKIIFMGTPEFGAIILEKLINSDYKPILIVTAPDKPVGRKQTITPPPVKIIAERYGIQVLQPEKIRNLELEAEFRDSETRRKKKAELSSRIKNLKPDLIIVAAYSQIIPKEILEIPKYGCLNIHPSLLPRWRGSSPIQYAILYGDKKTGVTIILMDEKIDHGPIIAQSSVKIEKNEKSRSLHDKLANLGADLILETIWKWRKGLIKPRPQDEKSATFSKILIKESGKINWKKTADEIEREIRAFNLWPGSFTFWQKDSQLLRIKILKARVYKKADHFLSYPIGKTLVVPQNEIGVQCRDNFLVIEKLQLEGKKETFSDDFIRGHPEFIGTILK